MSTSLLPTGPERVVRLPTSRSQMLSGRVSPSQSLSLFSLTDLFSTAGSNLELTYQSLTAPTFTLSVHGDPVKHFGLVNPKDINAIGRILATNYLRFHDPPSSRVNTNRPKSHWTNNVPGQCSVTVLEISRSRPMSSDAFPQSLTPFSCYRTILTTAANSSKRASCSVIYVHVGLCPGGFWATVRRARF